LTQFIMINGYLKIMVTYLNEKDIAGMGCNWNDCIGIIEQSCFVLLDNDYCQPIKPYLHFGKVNNRIIAMPAWLGGKLMCSGIKWIASFPENIKVKKARANSVTILNDTQTGEPFCIINTSLISVIRTVSVSGAMLKRYLEVFKKQHINIGIIGLGPIGQYHIKMCLERFNDSIKSIRVFDINNVPVQSQSDKIIYCSTWQDVYNQADCFITCTVSDSRYVDIPPKEGSLHLNVSLRDYKEDVYPYFKDAIIVDDWEEVCRKNTDIELFSKKFGLKKENTLSMVDVICENKLNNFNDRSVFFFSPMGMAVFDIAIANYYYLLSEKTGAGLMIE
jgi:2,3-diaminopropionate biosynthesis protein SbnB